MNCSGMDTNQEAEGETQEVRMSIAKITSSLLKIHQDLIFTHVLHNIIFKHTSIDTCTESHKY